MLFVTGTNVLGFFYSWEVGGGGEATYRSVPIWQGYVLKEWSQIVYSWWKCGMIALSMNLLTW